MLTTVAREAPAPSPIRIAALATPPTPTEPELRIAEIQGNIFPGFNKDHQVLLFCKITDANQCRKSLASLVPFISTTEDVLAFNRLFKSLRTRQGDNALPQSVWVNIAFAFSAIHQLMPDADAIEDTSFKRGMNMAAASLGDPVDDLTAAGNPKNWLVGGPTHPVDIVIILAGDDLADLLRFQSQIESSLIVQSADAAVGSGLQVVFRQSGDVLPAPKRGHEQFGFLDGVSQPGIRGRVSSDPSDLLTPRQNPHDPDQGKPGQDLLWPGEFVFGYPQQDPNKDIAESSDDLATGGPEWMEDGSFLVFRRLRQDVGEFHRFLKVTASKLGMAPELLGAKIVGRWMSGAPILRATANDNAALGDNDCANNNFEFFSANLNPPDDQTQSTQCAGTSIFPPSPGDRTGAVIPFCGHIRKSYPRDDITPGGTGPSQETQSETSERDTQTRRLLRRGIPFGPPSASTPNAPLPDDQLDRGLLFLAYQTSIQRQFEFVTKFWVNNSTFASADAGIDLVIGQNSTPGAGRIRRAKIDGKTIDTTGFKEWVIPTGGEYFFAPSISTLKKFAGVG